METLDAWKAHSKLTLNEAVLLICGLNPSNYVGQNDVSGTSVDVYPLLTALVEIVDKKAREVNENAGGSFRDWEIPVPSKSKISVQDLREWLLTTDLRPEFFFPKDVSSVEVDAFLDKGNKNYSAKLAASVRAWRALTTDPKLILKGKSPKESLKKWLEDNAVDLGLVKSDGEINAHAIDQAASVANWQPEGGANKTGSPKS